MYINRGFVIQLYKNYLMTSTLTTLMTDSQKILKKQDLWQNHYSNAKCAFQCAYMSFTLFLWWKLTELTISYHIGPAPVIIGFIIAEFLVDFVSGILHWACDTWGQFTTPIVGPTLIRSFRMHHVDPQDITRHGFIQTNASTTYPMPPFIGFALLICSPNFLVQCYCWTIVFGVILGILTNEIHKWAHMVHQKPNFVIRFLQSTRLILSHQEHHRHHTGQFDTGYCIINGWMNPILERIDFWRKFQNFITKYTGAVPRNDDFFWRQLKNKNN